MIKIDDDIFYLSAGEACYIFALEDGVPVHVYFGKRIEPEDDVRAMLAGENKAPELSVQAVDAEGKKRDLTFTFVAADVEELEEKTLVVTLEEKSQNLTARLYYTPHPRGGITRRAEIEGGAGIACCIKQSVNRSIGCEILVADGYNNATHGTGYLAVATSNGTDERYGDAYGFLCAAADGAVTANGSTVSCDFEGEIKDVLSCPEVLCVYSDSGLGGMTRIFHDILREKNEGLNERVPTVLFLPKGESSVDTAAEIGFGVVALDGGSVTLPEINALAEKCKEHGIALGLRVIRDCIEKDSALYSSACKRKGGSDVYKYDHSDEATIALIDVLSGIIEGCGVRFVTVDASRLSDAKHARGIFMLKDRLEKRFDGLRVDFGITSDTLGKEFTFCYPLGMVRNIISPSQGAFKSRFDIATVGTLGYELPSDVPDGIKRAARAQMLSYQDDARLIMSGDMYRMHDSAGSCRVAVRKDKSRAYAVCEVKARRRIKFFGLDEHNLYHVRELDKTFSGAALISCGIQLEEAGTYVFHVLQVADY